MGYRKRGATVTMSAMIVFKAVSVFLCPVVCHTNVLSTLKSAKMTVCAKDALRRITRMTKTKGTVSPASSLKVTKATAVAGVVHIVVLTPMLIVVDFTLTKQGGTGPRNGTRGDGVAVP